MIKISQGKIKLENKVIDLSNFQIRLKATEQDLEKYYDEFIEHAEEVGGYFKDRNAFDRALIDASKEKRPKLIPRDTKYPFMWAFRSSFMPFDFLKPSKRRLHDKYFMTAHCVINISGKEQDIKKSEKSLDERLRKDIIEKFKQYPGYEGIIELPNDRTPPETKSATFHESLHYLMSRYQAETGKRFVMDNNNLSEKDKYMWEQIIHERAVEILTDKLLNHDKDAQFENRWLDYSLNDGFKALAMTTSAIATGVLLGYFMFNKPYLLPLAFIPGRIRDYALKKHKQSKREEILQPREYPEFKI